MRPSAVAAELGLVLMLALAPAAAMAAPPLSPTLVEYRAAHHAGFDRIVFELEGGLPERTTARWVDRVTRDPSGMPLAVHGNAFIGVVLQGVTAHEESPDFASTYGPRRRAFDLPNIAHVAEAGDFEAVVSFGIGLMARTRILRRARLADPDRFVIDVSTRFERYSRPGGLPGHRGARSRVTPVPGRGVAKRPQVESGEVGPASTVGRVRPRPRRVRACASAPPERPASGTSGLIDAASPA